ncbi:HEAT repeat-containing protein [Methanobrevibacter ruminantium M1]|uniref:HEAT repeat-containing protein n=1 Tax=Methanobrevibacter ruminantium (strain ATCC 35063 / DSM 1093 / JCM 13430 / OCM 146 / M1) TaxID=634498 RepID=D3E2X4_METRM|nr:HEAT repeat domain-containing protein [Methanobrevibacter ruminantium]ADC46885.1 HEAT repeat-containing protein [Methanobrevibacter ruminantium M1]
MEKSIDELILDLKDEDDFVREEAIGSLELKGEEAVCPLIEALGQRNKDIKIGAAQVLAAIGDKRAIPALVATLGDRNKLVRREASTALTTMGDEAIEPVIAELDNPKWRVRGAACWVLGALDAKEALPKLEELLNDESSFVQYGAKDAINRINNG